jgi:hypothetical protein
VTITRADMIAVLFAEDAPADAYPVAPAKPWDARGPRIVRRSIEGDDGRDGDEQFRDAHHALRAWHRWRNADAVSVPSTSLKPGASRVDSGGSGGSKVPTLGGRITAKLHAHSVEPSVRAACVAGYVTTDGRVRLEAGEVAVVVVGILDGLSAQQIADDLNAARAATGEHTVTAVHVGRCRVRAWALVGESLVARKLTPPSERRPKVQEETRMALPPTFDLETWKEIASHCGESESSVKRAAKADGDPLPVHDYRGRVVARRSELTAWCSRQVRSRTAPT